MHRGLPPQWGPNSTPPPLTSEVKLDKTEAMGLASTKFCCPLCLQWEYRRFPLPTAFGKEGSAWKAGRAEETEPLGLQKCMAASK